MPECSGVAQSVEEGGTGHGCQSTVDSNFSPFGQTGNSFPGEVKVLEELKEIMNRSDCSNEYYLRHGR